MLAIAILLSIVTLVVAPLLASKLMGLKGGIGKAALVGLISLGLMQIIGLVARHLGPLGDLLGLMAGLAAWFQVVKIVHGTETAKTIVFMFWQLFFMMLLSSLLALFFGAGSVTWFWG